ncbi:MAG TPA: transposase [Ilumatobacteraceae bacterium]|nr:transposase [Ilumatobacteraceae bacterium]
MTRQRDLTSSDWFHLVQKGADAQDIFSAASHRSAYEDLMVDAFRRSRIELHAYAWMTNHTHQLVHAPHGGVAEAMHRLGTRYASLYNGWTDRSGPLFTARYHSVPITSDAQLAQTARYIHRNLLAIVGARRLTDDRWSSLGALCGRRSSPDWLATGVVTSGFDADSYERYVLTSQPSDRIGRGDLPPSTPTGCDEIEWAVATVVGRSIDDLRRSRGTVRDDARILMITLAVECRTAGSSALAERYGLSDPRSVRRAARRGRTLASQSPAFAAMRVRVLDQLDRAAAADLDLVPRDPGAGNRWAG